MSSKKTKSNQTETRKELEEKFKVRNYTSYFTTPDINHIKHVININEYFYDEIHLIEDPNNHHVDSASEKLYRIDYTYQNDMMNSTEFCPMFHLLSYEKLINEDFTLFVEDRFVERTEYHSGVIRQNRFARFEDIKPNNK